MKDLNITLRRNLREQDWSVEINDKVYQSVNSEFVLELVKQALNDAKQSVNEAAARRTN